MPPVVSTGMCSVSPGRHIHSSPYKKKYQFFQFLFEFGVSYTSLNNGLLGTKLYLPFDWFISSGR